MLFTENGFEFTEKNGGACVTKLLTPGAACIIPEKLGGMPVTELADRAAAGQPIREIYLPKTLRRVGRYGFYNCEALKILHFYAETREIGGGVLNGCKNIREIYIHFDHDERSALRDFVTEISERITVHYILKDEDGTEQERARLVFPEYYDEAIENTPARNLSFEIHGSGQKYRYCFGDRKLQFDRYDHLFSKEIIEESIAAAAEIAINRLQFPYGLQNEARKRYEAFLREHLFEVLLANLDHAESFKWLIKKFADRDVKEMMDNDKNQALSMDELDELIHESSLGHKAELSGILLDLKRSFYPPKRKTFDF